MSRVEILNYLEFAGITRLNPTESLADAVRFVNGESRFRIGCKYPELGGPLPGFYTCRDSFVMLKTRN